jgi:RNA polymerase sigma-70 factor (ECF subfamily)
MAATTGIRPESGGASPSGDDELDRVDARLVDRAQGGDLAGFEELYRRHASRVYGLCLRMTADRDLAEELTQDVFVRVWEKLHLFKAGGSFGAWLRKVAVNVVLSHRRWKRRHTSRLVAAEVAGPAANREPVMRPEYDLDLENAVAGLPPRARMVFVLHDVEGYRHQEIARLMNLAVGTSKAQLHRARRLLREALRR